MVQLRDYDARCEGTLAKFLSIGYEYKDCPRRNSCERYVDLDSAGKNTPILRGVSDCRKFVGSEKNVEIATNDRAGVQHQLVFAAGANADAS